MASSKFQIFCDDEETSTSSHQTAKSISVGPLQPQANQAKELQSLATKREPLAVRKVALQQQHIQQQIQLQQHYLNQQQQHSSQSQLILSQPNINNNNNYHGSSSATTDEDQENDISMASLGSDFDPSIIHMSRHFDDTDDEHHAHELDLTVDDSFKAHEQFADSFISEVDSEDDGDDDDDDELMMELDSAFKQHDSSIAYKSIDYVADIMDYLFMLERGAELRANPNYMASQLEIDSDKRRILVDWLIDVNEEFEMQPETLFMTVNLVDRFLSAMVVQIKDLQLVGTAAMFIASKYEEIYPPELHRFASITEDSFSGTQIRLMEQKILQTLDFRLSIPSSLYFLQQIFTYNKFTKQVYHLAEFLCYLAIQEDQPFLTYYPSEIAYSAVILAAYELDAVSRITPEIRNNFDKANINQLERLYNTSNAPLCIEGLLHIQRNAKAYNAIYAKFSSSQYESVASVKPCSDQIVEDAVGN